MLCYKGPYAYTTATARTTPSEKCVYILLWNFAFNWNYPVCLSVLKLAPAEYATDASSSEQKLEKLVVVVTFSRQRRIWSFHVAVLQRTAKKCTKNYNACARPLFCSLSHLFGDVLVTVAVVFCVRSPFGRSLTGSSTVQQKSWQTD